MVPKRTQKKFYGSSRHLCNRRHGSLSKLLLKGSLWNQRWLVGDIAPVNHFWFQIAPLFFCVCLSCKNCKPLKSKKKAKTGFFSLEGCTDVDILHVGDGFHWTAYIHSHVLHETSSFDKLCCCRGVFHTEGTETYPLL